MSDDRPDNPGRPWACEPYQNGKGWFHERGCPHVDWEDAYIPPRDPTPQETP